MERICRQRTGLFPTPDKIERSCSCPDWADMCKHVAAVLYGIGARLDKQPELLFRLHKVDEKELIAKASKGLPLAGKGPMAEKILGSDDDLSALFGLEMAQGPNPKAKSSGRQAKPKRAKKLAGKADKAASAGKGKAQSRTRAKP